MKKKISGVYSSKNIGNYKMTGLEFRDERKLSTPGNVMNVYVEGRNDRDEEQVGGRLYVIHLSVKWRNEPRGPVAMAMRPQV